MRDGGAGQDKDRPEQEADGCGHDGDRLDEQGSRLPDAVFPRGHLLPGGHVPVSAEPAEHAQHPGELGIGREEAGLDEAKLVLLVVAKAYDVLLGAGMDGGREAVWRPGQG